MSGILPSVVSAQLCGKIPIRPKHLAAYLRLLDRQARASLLDAWLRDTVGRDIIAQLLDGTKTNSMTSVEENQSRMLEWWATAIARDSKVAKILTMDLRFECPNCGQHLSATRSQIGVTAPCPNCNAAVTVPKTSTLPHSPPAPRQTKFREKKRYGTTVILIDR
jgi:predicted RNA-binding Zn-ribbon protein involved in translation (DUF1610 family)